MDGEGESKHADEEDVACLVHNQRDHLQSTWAPKRVCERAGCAGVWVSGTGREIDRELRHNTLPRP